MDELLSMLYWDFVGVTDYLSEDSKHVVTQSEGKPVFKKANSAQRRMIAERKKRFEREKRITNG